MTCLGSVGYDSVAGRYYYHWKCTSCGKDYWWGGIDSGNYYCSNVTTTETKTVWSCGKTDGQIETAPIKFN